MSLFAFAVVLFAAALHAAWNAIVKADGGSRFATVLVTLGAAAIAAVVLPFVPPPAPASWPYLIASTVLQIVYFAIVAAIYRRTDMSFAYPLMRGSAPMLVAIVSVIWLGDAVSPAAWIGIGVISTGILAMTATGIGSDGEHRHIVLPLLNALVIAAYTLTDGIGVRLSAEPLSYTLWIFLLTGIPFLLHALVSDRAGFRDYARRRWPVAVIGGTGTAASYGLALWAMTFAPIAIVAALRETAILFGMAISGFILKEPIGRGRIAAAVLIVGGAVALRLG